MAAIAVAARNTRLDDAETIDDWQNIGGGAGGAAETDFFYQGSNCFARKGGTAERGIYLSDDSTTDLTGTGTYQTVMFKFICTTPGLLDPISTPGQRLEIGSSNTAFYFYDVQGNDTYPNQSFLILPIDPNIAGHRDGTSGGGPTLTACDYYALRYDQSGVSKSPNQALDAVDAGAGLNIIGGDGTDADGTWGDFVQHDEGTTSNRYGYVRTSEEIVFVYGDMAIGRNTSDTAVATVFNDSAQTIVFPDGLFAAGFSGVTIDLGDATTDVDFNTTNFLGRGTEAGEDTRPVLTVTGTSGSFDSTSCTFDFFANITLTSASKLDRCTISNSEFLTQGDGTLESCTIFGATTTGGTAFILSSSPNKIKDSNFLFSAGHAIELDTTGTYSFVGNIFTNYDTTTDSTNAAIYNNSGGAVTLNVSGGGNTPSIRNGSGASTTVNNTVSVTIGGLKDNSEVRIYETGTTTEVAGIETATDGATDNRSFTYSDDPTDVVDIVVNNIIYKFIKIFGFTTPATDTTVPIQQAFDRNYSNP